MFDIVSHEAKRFLDIAGPRPIAIGLVIAAILLYMTPKTGRRFVLAGAALFWFLATAIGARVVSYPLTRGFEPVANAAAVGPVGAIVVLGGGVQEPMMDGDVVPRPSRPTAWRVLEAVQVFRLLGGEPFVVASGGKPEKGQVIAEGDVIADILVRLHVPRERILTEDESLNTHDEAIIVTRLLRARGISRFVLVTSPTHMWRSLATFRAQGADVIPSPAPLGATAPEEPDSFVPSANALEVSAEAAYDYAGILVYWARGWFRPEVLTR